MAGDGMVRRIGSLYAVGSLAGLGDGRLLGRFVDGSGAEREDAFAALVLRHGPMVLGTCRRMLGGSAEADDAFQAVFLVLARKADSLRGSDDISGWLRATAVRVGREARTRRAKLRLREGIPLDDSRAAAAVDPDLFDVLAALDEELERLPGRFREAIRLCELEGVPRRDAADRLGLAEGTLSSRLARGRSLLRDRLARRGLAVFLLATALPPAARSTPLPDATLQRALGAITIGDGPGAVSEAAASLAEGVLAMLALSRWNLLARSTCALAALTLGVGVAWGLVGRSEEPAPAAPKPADTPPSWSIRGVAVDEAGAAIAGAAVLLNPYANDERRGVTGPDGSFAIPVEPGGISRGWLLIRASDGRKLGWQPIPFKLDPTRAQVESPVRILVAPGREMEVRVLDLQSDPVEGASVEVVADRGIVVRATTGRDGLVRLLVPANARSLSIATLKAGVGVDSMTLDDFTPGDAADDPPRPLTLVIGDPWTARIRVVDEAGALLPGVVVRASGVALAGYRRDHSVSHRDLLSTVTGRGGVAVFEWLPRNLAAVAFQPVAPGFGDADGTLLRPEDSREAEIRLRRRITSQIRGRVLQSDGTPKSGIRIRAGRAKEDHALVVGTAWTTADGRYSIDVPPGSSYSAWVEDPDWAAPTRRDLTVRAGEPTFDVDFRLVNGTLIRGVLTTVSENRPASQMVTLTESLPLPIPRPLGWSPSDLIVRRTRVLADTNGRYSVRVVPGKYTLATAEAESQPTVDTSDHSEVVVDFRISRPASPRLTGRVVDLRGEPVAGARVHATSGATGLPEGRSSTGWFSTLRADADGRFSLDALPHSLMITAYSPDGGLAGYAEVGRDDREVLVRVAPSARLTGVLVDGGGKPRAWLPMSWGFIGPKPTSIPIPSHQLIEFGTDERGRFVSPPLITGVTYRVELLPRNLRSPLGWFPTGDHPLEKPGSQDLGTIRLDLPKR